MTAKKKTAEGIPGAVLINGASGKVERIDEDIAVSINRVRKKGVYETIISIKVYPQADLKKKL